MPEYEGYVTATDGEGRADVVIFPGRAFVPNAEHLNVCHCATSNSSFTVKALNPVGAMAGDLVAVRLEGMILAANLAVILGAAALGGTAALLTAIAFSSASHLWIWTSSGLLCGGLAGIALFVKRGQGTEPSIERVITRPEEAQGACKAKRQTSGCAGCSLSNAEGMDL